LPTHRLDQLKLVQDVQTKRARRNITQRTLAAECGIAAGTVSNFLMLRKVETDTALSLCAWLKRDINDYIVEGLPYGVEERWYAAHEDGRTVELERGATYARFIMRNPTGKQIRSGNRRYGSGFQGYETFIKDLTSQGFVETGRITK
jgi:transcriptional regulator with XRE-family HTH domain